METVGTSDSANVDDRAREMALFESALDHLTPSELVHQLEELTVILYDNLARPGDYEKQMRTRRVILRRLIRLNNLYEEGERVMEAIENAQQIDAFPQPSNGAQRKEKALSDHEAHKAAAIEWLRRQMVSLYKDRCFGYAPNVRGASVSCVNCDDARRVYEASKFPATYAATRAFFGGVFRGPEWATTGERVKSVTPGNHERKIECWRHV